MAQRPDQIRAPVPDGAFRRLGAERPGVEVKRLPDRQQEAPAVGRGDLMGFVRRRGGGRGEDVGLDVDQVGVGDPGVGGIGEDGKIMAAIGA